MEKKIFVYGRSHFRHKNSISGLCIRLIFIAVIRVHGVAQLMRQCKNVVHRTLPVQKHIWMREIAAPGIGAGSLSLILPDVDPAFCVGFFNFARIPIGAKAASTISFASS